MRKLIFTFLIITFLSCEKTERDFSWPYKYTGTCKILQYNSGGTYDGQWNGIAVFIKTDSTDLEGLEFALNS